MSNHDHDLPPVDPRIAAAAAEGCEESRLLMSRRGMLGLSAGFFSWAFMPRNAEASGTDPRLLVVMLRGGLDGLHVAVPFGDTAYRESLRGNMTLDRSRLLSLNNSFFGLHPSLSNFSRLYNRGEAAIVHAVAPPLRNRSHFECQYNLESGYRNALTVSDGWLNRLLQVMPSGNSVLANLGLRGALEVGPTPFILAGRAQVVSWSPGGWPRSKALNDSVLELYRKTDRRLYDNLSRGMAADGMASGGGSAGFSSEQPSSLQKAFRGAGRLMAQDLGPRIAVLNVGGWDTHITQINSLNANLRKFDVALDDFRIATGPAAWRNTAVVCVTEFGRTAAANKNAGTDHGVGTVAFLAGGAIKGGRVIAEWPGLNLNSLQDKRDLKATCDVRALFKGILREHLDVPDSILDSRIFPDTGGNGPASVPAMRGLIRGS